MQVVAFYHRSSFASAAIARSLNDVAIEFNPDFHQAWNNRGIAMNKLGRYEEAIASYDRAIEFQPNDYLYWCNRCFVLIKLGKLTETIAGYQQALKIQPQSASILYNLACVYAIHGDIDNTLASLRPAIQIEPDKYINLARQDEDFRSVRQDPRFIALVS
jgi:tetratricopeptide (TPR) repeat protein